MSKRGGKKKNPGNVLLTIGILVCLAVMAYAGYRLITTLYAYRQGEKEYSRIADAYTTDTGDHAAAGGESLSGSGAYSGESGSSEADAALKPPIQVDFDALKKVNGDVVGWLYIPSLDISYPVMQGEDDDYYLHRTTERTYNFSGSIFMEAKNSGDFTDPNTIIYGHNMKNGSMFGTLSHLLTKEKYREDSTFWILTPEKNLRYRMFSLHETDAVGSAYTLFEGTGQAFADWADQMKSQSAVDLGVQNFSEGSRIVTLSTCTADSASRFVVQAVLDQG